MKKCFKCGEEKPVDEFYKHPKMGDGHLGKCKQCARLDVKERTKRCCMNPIWMNKERERCRNKQARYRALGVAAPSSKETTKRWYLRNKHKASAQRAANQAFKKGLIQKPDACTQCGKATTDLEKHHHDYSKPLDIVWLCIPCHAITRHKIAA